MGVIYIVLPLAIIIAAIAILAFIWATRTGQFDDLDTPSVRMLHDDEPLRRDGAGGDDRDSSSDP